MELIGPRLPGRAQRTLWDRHGGRPSRVHSQEGCGNYRRRREFDRDRGRDSTCRHAGGIIGGELEAMLVIA